MFLLVLALKSPAFADVSISASVDKNKVALNDSVRLSIVVQGPGNLPSPTLPDLSPFTVYSSGRSQSISFVNGQMSSSIQFNYLLTPKTPGHFTIAPFSVSVDGKSYQSEPIPIEVVQESPSPSAPNPGQQPPQTHSQAPGAFIKMTTDKTKVFLNEELVLSFRFYHRVSLVSNPEYRPSELSGFLYEDLPPPRNFVESVNGTSYRVTEIKTALFPTKTGKIVVPPAFLKIRVEDFNTDPFNNDFFNQFFAGGGREYELKTNSIEILVSPLPQEKRPQDFSGGVGSFKISASIDKSKTSVGEPVTLTVSIEGSGNIKSFSDPLFPAFTGFRKYDTASSLNLDKSKGRVEGSKVYKMILVPLTSGIQTIPPIAFSFLDPATRNYKTIKTNPIPLDIKPGKPSNPLVSSMNTQTPEIQKLQEEIRYIKSGTLPRRSFTWIYRSRWFLILNGVPVLVLLGSLIYRWRIFMIEKDPDHTRKQNAYRKAKKGLEKAQEALKEGRMEPASEKVLESLQTYLADHMLVPPAGLSLKSVQDFLQQAQVPSVTIQALRTLWEELQLIRFAPAQFRSADLEKIIEQSKEMIQRLERFSQRSKFSIYKNWILLLGILSVSSWIWGGELQEKFEHGNELYQKGIYQEALVQYEEILNQQGSSPMIEYNLGNTRYKMGEKGKAILHWRRAWRMDPRDSDTRHNLTFASSECGEPFVSDIPLLVWIQFLFHSLNLNEILLLWLLTLWVAGIFWSVIFVKRNKFFSRNNLILLATLSLLGVWGAFRFENEALQKWGVVTSSKAEVRSGPGQQFGVGFTVPEGRNVLILERSDRSSWIEIGIPQEGLKGWVEDKDVTQI